MNQSKSSVVDIKNCPQDPDYPGLLSGPLLYQALYDPRVPESHIVDIKDSPQDPNCPGLLSGPLPYQALYDPQDPENSSSEYNWLKWSRVISEI